jgi:anti-sigma factor RsiW
MGGRVLPTAHAPAAQLMYDDDHGTRLTVYVQPMGIDGEEFRYTQQGDIRTVVWAERRLALVVTGKMPRDAIMAVATRVRDAVAAGAAP